MQSIAFALLNIYLSARDVQERYSDSLEGDPFGIQDCPKLASTHVLDALNVRLRGSMVRVSGTVVLAQPRTDKISATAHTRTLRIPTFNIFSPDGNNFVFFSLWVISRFCRGAKENAGRSSFE